MHNPSPEHQKLVEALLNYFKTRLNYKILYADYAGYTEPDAQGRHAPDIIAQDPRGLIHIAEAKVDADITSQTAREQYVDFSNRIMTSTKVPVPFHIVVHKENEQYLIKQLNELGLGNMVGNRIKIWTL